MSPVDLSGLRGRVEGFARAPSPYSLFAIWISPNDDATNVAWARDLWSALRPFSSGVVYVNNLGDEGGERVRAAYGGNYARLAALKKRYDPDNVFSLNQNIRPQN